MAETTNFGKTVKAQANRPIRLGRSAISGQFVTKPVTKITAVRARRIREAVRKVLAEQQA